MNNAGYPVAVCNPNPGVVDSYAMQFAILGDGSLYNWNGSTVYPTGLYAKAPLENIAPNNQSHLYRYLRFGAEGRPFYIEQTFSNNSGFLDWQNVAFNNVNNPGRATFGIDFDATSFIGWLAVAYYGTDPLITGAPIQLAIQDVDSIDPPGKYFLQLLRA